MAKKYGSYPNVIYEPFNEPNGPSWTTLKPYFTSIVDSIRKYDSDNIIVCGTPNWSQYVDSASFSPIADTNIAYTLHYYAATHKDWLRSKAQTALNKGCALFVTEYGISEASGNGTLDYLEGFKWYSFLDKNNISYCNWSVSVKEESSSALLPGASVNGGWDSASISKSGWFVRANMRGDTFVIPKTSLNEENSSTDLQIFPNPTTGEINIRLPKEFSENAEIDVYDSSGRFVLFEKINSTKNKINISNLEKGTYHLRIITNNKVFIGSVIRN
jgi:aryl-phospho-beta-D-glucosidase BglC (GH1 family)